MSIAITNTETTIGRRTLGAYHRRNVYRAPAEPDPRAAANVARRLSGMGIIYPNGGAAPIPPIRIGEANFSTSPVPPTTNRSGTASQAPTGVVLSPSQSLGAPAVSQQQAPSVIPTSVATIAQGPGPGYVTISSGGGTVANPSPDYVAEVTAWLTETNIAQALGISGIPNYVPLIGAALLLGMVWGGGGSKHK